MEDVVKHGTGTACQLDNMAVAGKTGTTEEYNDLWFVGYTPYYTCAVWSGFDNNEKLPDYARDFHKTLWKKVMTRIHSGMEYKDFDMPSSVEKASICEETGLLPRAGCSVITEYFDIGNLPTETCDQHFYIPEAEPDETYEEAPEEPELSPTPDPNNNGGNPGDTDGDPGDTDGDPGDTDGDPGDTDGDPGDTDGDPGDTDGDPGQNGGDPGETGIPETDWEVY